MNKPVSFPTKKNDTSIFTQDPNQNKTQKNGCETKRLTANKMCILTVVSFERQKTVLSFG
jgi:hypothetical protein